MKKFREIARKAIALPLTIKTKDGGKTVINKDINKLAPYPKSKAQKECKHEHYRFLNRNERRKKEFEKIGAEAGCLDCGCLFVNIKDEVTFGDKK